MALLNRPLTEDEAREMLQSWRQSDFGISFTHLLCEVLNNPTPHQVVYTGAKHIYVPPTNFPWLQPGDNVWIVPGTLERKL